MILKFFTQAVSIYSPTYEASLGLNSLPVEDSGFEAENNGIVKMTADITLSETEYSFFEPSDKRYAPQPVINIEILNKMWKDPVAEKVQDSDKSFEYGEHPFIDCQFTVDECRNLIGYMKAFVDKHS